MVLFGILSHCLEGLRKATKKNLFRIGDLKVGPPEYKGDVKIT